MKPLTVHDDIHREVKLKSAETGLTATAITSKLLRAALKLVEEKKLKLSEDDNSTPNEKEAA